MEITFTPSAAGSFSFTLTVKDKNNKAVSKKFTITVAAASSTKNSTQSKEETKEITSLKNNSMSAPYSGSGTAKQNETSSKAGGSAVTELKVIDEDILWQGEGREEDLVKVLANKPLTFVLGEWVRADGKTVEVFEPLVFINEKPAGDIVISEDGKFTLPAELVRDDFKVQVTALTNENTELETIELFISPEK